MKIGEVVYARTHAELLNELLGTNYKAWMKSGIRLPDGRWLWMIELGNFVSTSGWINRLVGMNKISEKHIGKDFSFVGQEYRIQVGGRDFYIDLLFYNRAYSCLVAFELKIGEFEPEYLSKMNFYLEALDRQERKEGDNPSVGIILCSSKNEAIVEYAKARSNSPTAISTYETKLIDKKLLQKKLIEYQKAFDDKD